MTKTIITLVVFLFMILFVNAQDCSQDNMPPTVKCKSNLTAMVGERITPDQLDGGSFDNCTPVDELLFTFCEIGPCINTTLRIFESPGVYPISLVVRDKNGNISACNRTITITANCEEDRIPPQGIVCYGDRAKTNTIIYARDRARAEDNCTPHQSLRYSFSPDINDNERIYTEPGIYPTTIYVTDENGNQSFCSSKMYVEPNCDEENYTLVCRNDVFAAINTQLFPYMFMSYSNCFEVNYENQGLFFSSHNDQTSIYFSEPGIYPIEIATVMPNGERISCNTNIQILPEGACGSDNTAPIFSCRSDVYIKAGEELYAPILIQDAEDDCTSSRYLRFSYSPVNRFDHWRTYNNPGTYDVTIYAHDEKGNVSSCQTQFLVVSEGDCEDDQLAPRPACISNVTAKPGEVIWTKDAVFSSYDNCSDNFDMLNSFAEEEYIAYLSFEESGIYPYTVWVTDENGNTTTCVEDVQVYDCNELELNIEVEMLGDNTGILKATTNIEHDHIFEYCWNDEVQSHSQMIAFSEAGNYSVTVVDQLQCTKSAEVNIKDSYLYEITSDCQDGTGNITINPTTDSPPYQFVYTLPDATQDTIVSDSNLILQELSMGVYDFTITDGQGNTEELALLLELTPFAPEVNLYLIPNCEIADIRTHIEEDYENLSYQWSTGATTKDLLAITPDTYTLSITNEYGCEVVKSITLEEQATLDAYFEIEFDCINRIMEFIPFGTDVNDNLTMTITEPTGQSWTSPIAIWGLDPDWPASTGIEIWGTYKVEISDDRGCSVNIEWDIYEGIFEDNCDNVEIEEECAIMQVDIAAPRIRRCFKENFYYVTYGNYGALLAENAYVEVELDPFLKYINSSIPYSEIEENTYRFDLGSVDAGKGGRFYIEVEVSCDAALGQTHCSEARIYPNQPCEASNLWSGAEVTVEATCEDNEVVLSIENTGTANMDTPLSYITIEDVVMLSRGEFQLNTGERQEFKLPKNGSTYRLQAEQVGNYPLNSQPSIALEGCGTNEEGTFSTGFITQFPLDENDRSVAIDCQSNIGSFDPNDKLATPIGVGIDHLLPKNTDIEYKIRFQNTGTDTAFTVVILDTLSSLLDTASIQLGTSSHPYTYNLLANNVIQFYFDNILLPDSSTNLLASEGFVQFKIGQLPNLPDGSLIENSAAIYFDFNAPIITNTVQHFIGEPMQQIINKTKQIAVETRMVSVVPNPSSTNTIISVDGSIQSDLQVEIYNQLGRLHLVEELEYNQVTIPDNLLNSGYYFFRIVSSKGIIGHGTLLKE